MAGNQFVIGDSEDEEEGDDEGEEGMDHVDILIMICHHVLSDHDQIGYSGPDGLRRRPPAMGEVGRKVTRHNLDMILLFIHIIAVKVSTNKFLC